MPKNQLIFILFLMLISPLIMAQSINIEFPFGNEFGPGENIKFKVTLYDENNNPINGLISVAVKDSENKEKQNIEIESKELVTINLGEKATSGQGTITAKYENLEEIAFFEIGRKELASFSLEGNSLKITNIGNTKYAKTVSITIGNTIGTKEPNLEIGKSVSYQLIAPEGVYSILVTDGKTTLERGSVRLTGTGQAIGALDERISERSGITGGISPDQNSDVALLSYVKKNKFIYVFIFAIFGAMILLAIERRFKHKTS